MAKKINSIRDCIDALGGPTRAAEFLRVGPSQVSNMLRDGCITSSHHMRVYFRLTNDGYEVDPVALFGVDLDGSPFDETNDRPAA